MDNNTKLKKAKELYNIRNYIEAKLIYLEILEKDVNNFEVMHMIGLINLNTQNYEESILYIEKAIKLKNKHNYYLNLGVVYKKIGEINKALVNYKIAIKLHNNYYEAYFNIANLLIEIENKEEAIYYLKKTISINPKFNQALIKLGVILFEKEKFKESILLYTNAINNDKLIAEAYNYRGIAYKELKEYDKSMRDYLKAIEINPNYSEVYCNMGVLCHKLKQYSVAIEHYNKSININNKFWQALFNRGNLYYEIKKYDKAIIDYDKALNLNKKSELIYCNKGIALQEMKDFDEAIQQYNKAIDLNQDFVPAYFNLGNVLQEVKQADLALEAYTKAYNLEPNFEFLIGMLLYGKYFLNDWQNSINYTNVLLKNIKKGMPATSPLVTYIVSDDPEIHYLAALKYTEIKHPVQKNKVLISKNKIKNKIRVGYFSADLHYHPVSIWLAEQVENRDYSKFEYIAFSFKKINDPMRIRLEKAFDEFIDVSNMSDQEISSLSHKLEIDIAIDLNGYTSDGRPGIFANRAAQIQINHIGFPGSMGSNYIDYFICDKNVLLPKYHQYFSEKIVYIPCSYTYDRQRKISELGLNRAQFGLPEKSFVFTCQNRCQKITPEVFDIWMKILKEIPDSVLWLMEPNNTAKRNLINEANIRGVSSNRLVFTKRESVHVSQEDQRISRYLESYKLADLFLDTWPYNAGTTAVDALWAGLPVMTKSGESVVARMATSALHAIEVPELITTTPEEYTNLAIELATNPQRLKEIKEKIKRNRFTTALFDPVTNTKHIEAAYLEMYRRYQADLPPDHLFIDGS